MKKKLLHIALATALLPVFTGCIGNFEVIIPILMNRINWILLCCLHK